MALALPTALSAPAQALVPAEVSLTAGPVSTITSVSPDVVYDAPSSTYYLFTTGMRIGVYTSSDGQTWTPASGASTPSPAFDPSVISLPDGSHRMYFTSPGSGMPGQPCRGKRLRYATSPDLLRWTTQPGVLLEDLGCGVPNVVRAGDRDYRLYYVRGGEGVKHGTYMATSTDGLAWTPRAGILTPSDMVDPSVVQLANGSWIMLTADFPAGKAAGPFFQKLYVGTSSDGFTWDFGDATPLYAAPPSEGAFDPDAVVMPDGSIRAWWAQGTSPDTARVAAGALAVSVAPVTPVPPTKPKATWSATSLKVTWAYAADAPTPESCEVQVRTRGTWSTVATVTGDRAGASVARAKLPKSAFSLRVIARIGDESASSPSTKVAKPRRELRSSSRIASP